MLTHSLISTVAPVFCIAILGYLWASRKEVDVGQLTDLVIYFFAPALIFGALIKVRIEPHEVLVLSASAAAICLGCGLLLLLSSMIGVSVPRGLYLPVMFANAGNLPLPLSLLAFGETGLAYQILFFVCVATLNNTLGIAIAKDKGGLAEIFRLPQIYAVVLALSLNYLDLAPPEPLARAIELMGMPAVPLMLLALGMRIASLRLGSLPLTSLAAAIRMGGGLLIGFLCAWVLGLHGPAYRAVILGAGMPAAVINFAYAEKYHADAELVASTILLTTLLSVAGVPLVLGYLLG